LAAEADMAPDTGVDYIIRGEGEITFHELVRAIENNAALNGIAGLSCRADDRWFHNSDRDVHSLENGEIRLPNRRARVLNGYTFLGKQVDVIETSRGCTFDCSFCSIIEMRGRNFKTYSFERVLNDIRDARDHGARAICARRSSMRDSMTSSTWCRP
jgi:anaerobic magnesium-protoporphyrin IX monomethyl ester cyclase